MVDAFFEHASKKVENLTQAVSTGDWSNVVYLAHNLKGSAASLGLRALENCAQQLESRAQKRESDTINEHFEGFVAVFEHSVSTLRDYWVTLDGADSTQGSETAANM